MIGSTAPVRDSKPWTGSDISVLREMSGAGKPVSFVATVLDRSIGDVRRKAVEIEAPFHAR